MHLYLKAESWRYEEIHHHTLNAFYDKGNLINDLGYITKASIDRGYKAPYVPEYNTLATFIIEKLYHWSSKSKFIFYVLVFFKNVFEGLAYNWHLQNLRWILPEIILACIFFYELCNQQFKYLYYYLFIYLFILLSRRLFNFLRQPVLNFYHLGRYFYKNEIPYETQRFYILNDKEDSIICTSDENEELYKALRKKPEIVEAIITNKTQPSSSNRETKLRLFLSVVITFLIFLMIYKYG